MIGVEIGRTIGVTVGASVGVATRLQRLEEYLSKHLVSWARADSVVDPLSNNKISAWVDRVADGVGARAVDSAHAFEQATPANQGSVVTLSELGDLPAVRLVGASSVRYVSSLPPSFWPFFHDGTGFLAHVVMVPRALGTSQFYLSTDAGSGPGWGILTQTTSNVGQVVRNGSGTILLPLAPAATLVVGQATLVETSYLEGASPESRVRKNGATVASANSSGAPSSADPTHPLQIGGHQLFGQYPTADIADVLISDNAAATQAAVREYVALRYGQPSWAG